MRRHRFLFAPVLLLGGLAACSNATVADASALATFVVEVSGEEFRVQVTTEAQASALRARMQSGLRNVVQGTLVAGDGGFNGPWKWHLQPSTVAAPDLSIELCDGRPSMVDANLTYWLASVKAFCPWGAKVVREEQ
jgi:hypothetical protein